MWAVIGSVFQLLLLLLKRWFAFSDKQKEKAKEILKEVPNAKDPVSITRAFDRINRMR